MGPKTTELLALLDQAVALLHSINETGWASWIEAASQRIRNYDYRGVGHFLDAFRGDASIQTLASDTANHDLLVVLGKACAIAKDVRRAAHLDPLDILKTRLLRRDVFTEFQLASFAIEVIEPENIAAILAVLPQSILEILREKAADAPTSDTEWARLKLISIGSGEPNFDNESSVAAYRIAIELLRAAGVG